MAKKNKHTKETRHIYSKIHFDDDEIFCMAGLTTQELNDLLCVWVSDVVTKP